MPTMSKLSTPFLHVRATVTEGLAAIDPADITAALAVVSYGAEPVDADWQVAEVEGDGRDIIMRVLVGKNSPKPLDKGNYGVWYRIQDNPEDIVDFAGFVEVN